LKESLIFYNDRYYQMASVYECQQTIATQTIEIILEAQRVQDSLQKLVENINKFEGDRNALLDMLHPLVSNGIKQSVLMSPSVPPSVSPLVSPLVSPSKPSRLSSSLPLELFSRENDLYRTTFIAPDLGSDTELFHGYFNQFTSFNEKQVYSPSRKFPFDFCGFIYCLHGIRNIKFHDDGKLHITMKLLNQKCDEWTKKNSSQQTFDGLRTACIDIFPLSEDVDRFDENDQAFLKRTCNSSVAVVLYCAYICWCEIMFIQKNWVIFCYNRMTWNLFINVIKPDLKSVTALFIELCYLVKDIEKL